ncbi:SpoIIE family protein phosphatase [Streptomyces sp. NPDC059122]|uniref:SpoIIE family protein phosphatase n=1 Tax=Streptomyces sp. NPDC059122 TaxID=3346732 RepID=UPI00368F38CC
MNQLVEVVRSWLDESSVTVAELHRRLTVEHFREGGVPPLKKLRTLLAGEGLTWELVEAAADVCFPEEPATSAQDRLAPMKQLWQAAQTAPSTARTDALPSVARELLEAKDRTIAAYQEIDRARQAFQASEHGRLQALQAATVVFALLGQAQATVAELQRQVDALRAAAAPAPERVAAVEQRLQRAVQQETELRQELERAERERDTAQQVADHAARRIQALEEEVARLRSGAEEHSESSTASESALPDAQNAADGINEATFDDVDRTLAKVRSVLDREHEVVQDAADEVGWHAGNSGRREGVTVVPGQVVGSDGPATHSSAGPSGLFRTTENNSPAAGERTSGIVARDSADRTRFLGAATRRIARGIDLDEIVLGLCRATVPTFSDAIMVYLRDPLPVGDERPFGPVVLRLRRTDHIPEGADAGGSLLPALPRQPDLCPAMGGTAAELAEVRADGPLAEALRGVRPLFGDVPVAQAALPELLGPDTWMPPDQRVILAPLRGRRRVIGATVFLRRPDRTPFEPDDLLAAAQLATHTALGVDKAVLYGREAYIADALQRRMLPASLPQPPGVRLASRYLPASDSARVGGDWYDSIPLPGGQIGLMVGDVLGHSMTSAAIMGQLRTSAQTLAPLGLPPQEVLRRLDEQAQRLGTDSMATCMYAVYDPDTHRISMANAGHPPPVMLHRDGRAEVLRIPLSAPIGVGGADFEAVELDAPVGATLVLYTDGLVESRTRDVWTGIEQLCERLIETARLPGPNPPPLEPLCDEILDMLGPGDRDDDIALFAVRFGDIEEAAV